MASSTPYWISGLSTSGNISFGCALVAGRKRVPSPAAGNTALRTFAIIVPNFSERAPLVRIQAMTRLQILAGEVIACERCPELREYCRRVAETKKRAFRDQEYWGRPVPPFGDPRAKMLVIGLAP